MPLAALAPRTLTGRGFRRATMPRKTTKPAPPVVLTPEQIEAQAIRKARDDAHQDAREALLAQALSFARKLSDRVFVGHVSDDSFAVMFGPADVPRLSFSGPGLVELRVELAMWKRNDSSDGWMPPHLQFRPRCYSLDSEAALSICAAQGQALLDAANFGRTIIALTNY